MIPSPTRHFICCRREQGPITTASGRWVPGISAFTRVHSPSKTGVNALKDTLCAGTTSTSRIVCLHASDRPRRPALTMGECPLNCANRQQRKGGDPVSHCLSPRLAAPVSWILPAMGVPRDLTLRPRDALRDQPDHGSTMEGLPERAALLHLIRPDLNTAKCEAPHTRLETRCASVLPVRCRRPLPE